MGVELPKKEKADDDEKGRLFSKSLLFLNK